MGSLCLPLSLSIGLYSAAAAVQVATDKKNNNQYFNQSIFHEKRNKLLLFTRRPCCCCWLSDTDILLAFKNWSAKFFFQLEQQQSRTEEEEQFNMLLWMAIYFIFQEYYCTLIGLHSRIMAYHLTGICSCLSVRMEAWGGGGEKSSTMIFSTGSLYSRALIQIHSAGKLSLGGAQEEGQIQVKIFWWFISYLSRCIIRDT